jgi:uncharacterized protein (TIGR02145 family)
MKTIFRISGVILLIFITYSCKKDNPSPVDYTGQIGTVNDIDGNSYPTIGIGSQIWLAENLKTTKYSNGDLIGTTTGSINGKYQWAYDDNESNVAIYGRLYTWYAATDSRNVCPTGWHLPTDSEWSTLTIFLGGDESIAGCKLKETGTTHWRSSNNLVTNESGFTALPGGCRAWDDFYNVGSSGYWWSSTAPTTSSFYRHIYDSDCALISDGIGYNYGFSVRCLKDN